MINHYIFSEIFSPIPYLYIQIVLMYWLSLFLLDLQGKLFLLKGRITFYTHDNKKDTHKDLAYDSNY